MGEVSYGERQLRRAAAGELAASADVMVGWARDMFAAARTEPIPEWELELIEAEAADQMLPDATGEAARFLDATGCADALVVWLSEHGAVWVTDEGEIAMKSRYTGGHVSHWHGHAIVAAERWTETKMPVSVGETITAERAGYVAPGTVLVRVDDRGRVLPAQTVLVTGKGFTPSAKCRYRVLDLPAREVSS